MEVKSFTYRKSLFGTYYKQGLLNVQKMDDHIAKMLKRWLGSANANGAQWRAKGSETLRKRDTITVSFRKK